MQRSQFRNNHFGQCFLEALLKRITKIFDKFIVHSYIVLSVKKTMLGNIHPPVAGRQGRGPFVSGMPLFAGKVFIGGVPMLAEKGSSELTWSHTEYCDVVSSCPQAQRSLEASKLQHGGYILK